MTVVVDASVVIKWLLQDPEREVGTEKATQLMESVTRGELTALQPTHWLAEVGVVLARESPGTAADDVTMLNALQLAGYLRAARGKGRIVSLMDWDGSAG